MVAVLIRLKLRLLVNGLRASPTRMQFFVLSVATALVFATGGFLLFLAAPPRLPTFAFPLFAAAWAVFPLLAFGIDETLDPARLAVLPLRARDTIPGLLLAGAMGPWPIAFLVALLGSVPGYGRTPAAAVIALVAVLVTFTFCLAVSRAVATSMARLLRSRRGRDLGMLVGTALSVLLVVTAQTQQPMTYTASTGTSVLRWTPPGFTGHAMFALRRGELLEAAANVAVAAVLTLLVLAWWALAMPAAQVPSDQSNAGARRLPFGGRTPLGAVVAKELRYAMRDPVRRAQLPSFATTAVMVTLSARQTGSVYPVLLVAVLSGVAVTSNQVGEDRSAYWLHVHAGNSGLLGKNVVRGGIAAIVTTATGVAAGAVTGDWAELPAVLLMAYGALLLATGLSNVIAVRVPFPPPKSENPFASDPGKGCAAGAYGLAATAACAVLLAPSVLLGVVGLPYAGAALALAVGAVGWVAGTRVAERFVALAQPEILAAIVRNGG